VLCPVAPKLKQYLKKMSERKTDNWLLIQTIQFFKVGKVEICYIFVDYDLL